MPDTPPHILIVDDDRVVAQFMAVVLKQHGVTTSIEPDGTHALARVAAESFDLVVVDVNLPGADGIQLAGQVKRTRPSLPVIVVTGHRRFDYAVGAIEARADEFLVKPFGPDEFARKVMARLHAARETARRPIALAVGAHPDDVEIGCGGVLLEHRRRGDDVVILTLTGGEHGGDHERRARESKDAAAVIGAALIHRDLPDTSLPEAGPTIEAIQDAIEVVRPTVIYTHSLNDNHQDHRACHRATVVAGRGIPEIHCYQAPSTAVSFAPSRFVDISEVIDRKIDAIRAFTSQWTVRDYLEEDLIRSTARYWGRFGGGRFAEPLETIRAGGGFADLDSRASGQKTLRHDADVHHIHAELGL
jgi:LmbE family N-acetylglucosaminyl deacetylase